MEEMREVARLNRDYLASALVIIVLVVGLVFGFQLARLQHAQTVLSAQLDRVSGDQVRGCEGNWCLNSDLVGQDQWGIDWSLLRKLDVPPVGENDNSVLSVPVIWDGEYRSFLLNSALPPLSRMGEGNGLNLMDRILPRKSDLIIRFQPRLAIVIDDWGYDWAAARDFLTLEIPFTAAVLPHRAKTSEQVALLRQRGHEIILHLPMEPKNPTIEPGKGAITVDLPDAEIRRRVEAALATVDGAVGVNNHMGSKATSDERVMGIVLEIVRKRGLYFIDSWTAPTSIAGELAEEMGVATATNQAFLDHYDDVEKVKSQLERLIKRAQKDGQALGIGHVRPQTYRGLVEMAPRFQEAGVIIVPASKIVSTPMMIGDPLPGSTDTAPHLDIDFEPAFGDDPARIDR